MMIRESGGQLCLNCMEALLQRGKCPVCGSRIPFARNPGRALQKDYLLHGRYRIGRVLGEGGFGITYLAWDTLEGCRVAVKEYMPRDLAGRGRDHVQITVLRSRAHYEKFLERFLSEAKIIYRYRDHPNIISVRHLFRENGTAYYVMEYLEGKDLRSRILQAEENRLSWTELKPVIAQAACALHTVHQSGIVHCDVSPDNIIIQEGGEVKLIDFGAAKSNVGGASSQIILKQGYAPPEQYGSGGRLGPWTDVYALAVTVYCCLAGQMPPRSIDRLGEDRLVPLSKLGVRLPDDFSETALQKGMEPYIRRRYQSVEHFWQELTVRSRSLYLAGRSGVWKGRTVHPPQMQPGESQIRVLYGGTGEECTISFPYRTAGVGAVHFRIWKEGERMFLMDLNSGYATYLDGRRLSPGLVYELRSGSRIQIGTGQIFEVV